MSEDILGWESLGACVTAQMSTEVFFPEGLKRRRSRKGEDLVEPLEACDSCRVRRLCLIAGVLGEEYNHGGIWGGAIPVQLKTLSKRTKGWSEPLRCEKCSKTLNFIRWVDEGEYCTC